MEVVQVKKCLMSIVAVFAIGYAVAAFAISGNPQSNVLYDSANTASNLVMRDANGAFSAGAITATSVTNTGQQLLQLATTMQLLTVVPIGAGATISVQLNTPTVTYSVCVASGTGAGAWVYPSTTTVSAGLPVVCK